jgi:hypothetical protein
LEQLVTRGRIGAWGITGIGVPTTIIATLNEDPAPAAVQVVANLLDSPGAMQRYDEPPRPREIIATFRETEPRGKMVTSRMRCSF